MTTFTIQGIQSQIKTLPNHPPFMLAQDLAPIYETKVKRMNEAVKRNPKRFPQDFCFRLTSQEVYQLKFWPQSATKIYAGPKKVPYAFTREGANMLSTVLHSEIAIQHSIQIVRAFSALEIQKSTSSEDLFETMIEILRTQATALIESQRISEQIQLLKERVKSKKNSRQIWFLFRQHFGVSGYRFLPKNQFRKALDWLENN